MSEVRETAAPESVQAHLHEIQALLDKQRLVEELVHKQEMPRQALVESLVHKQHVAELQKKLELLHPADIAYILEALPLGDRLAVWDLVKADRDGDILLEVSEPVRETLIAGMERAEPLRACRRCSPDREPGITRSKLPSARTGSATGARVASSRFVPTMTPSAGSTAPARPRTRMPSMMSPL